MGDGWVGRLSRESNELKARRDSRDCAEKRRCSAQQGEQELHCGISHRVVAAAIWRHQQAGIVHGRVLFRLGSTVGACEQHITWG